MKTYSQIIGLISRSAIFVYRPPNFRRDAKHVCMYARNCNSSDDIANTFTFSRNFAFYKTGAFLQHTKIREFGRIPTDSFFNDEMRNDARI